MFSVLDRIGTGYRGALFPQDVSDHRSHAGPAGADHLPGRRNGDHEQDDHELA
jgi:hypothetical protein